MNHDYFLYDLYLFTTADATSVSKLSDSNSHHAPVGVLSQMGRKLQMESVSEMGAGGELDVPDVTVGSSLSSSSIRIGDGGGGGGAEVVLTFTLPRPPFLAGVPFTSDDETNSTRTTPVTIFTRHAMANQI